MWTPESSKWCAKYFIRVTVIIGAIKFWRETCGAHSIVHED
jgi:hypothetical protein